MIDKLIKEVENLKTKLASIEAVLIDKKILVPEVKKEEVKK